MFGNTKSITKLKYKIASLEKALYGGYDIFNGIHTSGLEGEIRKLEAQNKELNQQLSKLKAILNELIDYTYAKESKDE